MFDKNEIKIMGMPKYKLKTDVFFRSSPIILKAIMQLPDLLKPGKKARHLNNPATKNFVLVLEIFNT